MREGGEKKHQTDTLGIHSETLHDMNEDLAGEKNNLATGDPIRNTEMPTAPADKILSVVPSSPTRKGTDALGALPSDNDAAAAWLRANGGTEAE